MSEIRVTDIKGEDGSAAVNFSKGINVNSGVITATTFVGNLTGNPTGSGANLTNLPAANITGTLPAIDGSNLTGITESVLQIREYVNRTFETQSFTSNNELATQLEGHITPTSASSKIRITLCAFFHPSVQPNCSTQIKKSTDGGSNWGSVDGTVLSSESVSRATGHVPSLWGAGRNWSENQMSVCTIVDSPNTTSQLYYRPFFIAGDNGTLQTNYNYNTSNTGNAYCKLVSVLRLEEIKGSTITLTNVT